MILFCEECGTRHDIDEARIKGNSYKFSCSVCNETLMVSLTNRQNGKTVEATLHGQGARPEEKVSDRMLKVLVVDDSRLIRKVLREIIEADGHLQVCGEAENGKKALELIAAERPDVITLDINMPVMDGLTTLKHIMINHPIPTVMISALTQEGAKETFDSLKYGAIDFLPKPSQVKGADLKSQREEIVRKIKLVSEVQIESVRYLRRPAKDKDAESGEQMPCHSLVIIGVAEGGYGTLLNVIPRLNPSMPAAYIAVMHQAPLHIDGFVKYLDQCSQLFVRRASDGLVLEGGHCYLSADTEFFSVSRQADHLYLKLNGLPDGAQQEAINLLMRSAADTMHENTAGVILTGTGKDGIEGLGDIIENRGAAFVQDPRSCLFKETPKKAEAKYNLTHLISDKQMAGAINAFLSAHKKSMKEMCV